MLERQQEELKALGGLKQDGDELEEDDDPENWDAFRDAHKFELLNQKKEQAR